MTAQLAQYRKIGEKLAPPPTQREAILTERLRQQTASLDRLAEQYAALYNSRTLKLIRLIQHEPFSLRKLGRAAYLLGSMILPARIKEPLRQLTTRVKNRLVKPATVSPYAIRIPHVTASNRPRILHALANFYTGGSSRLVVDLIERLGDLYEQRVLTSAIPTPPAYVGAQVLKKGLGSGVEEITEAVIAFSPDLIHVHYWGATDRSWYEKVIRAAERYGCPVVENVNTPVEPYCSPAITRYVYVSEYVRDRFGKQDGQSVVVHPGSDPNLFSNSNGAGHTSNCIGMVYRLEPDKLTDRSIEVFVKVAQQRPATNVLIVGGGSFLESYKASVRAGGVFDRFQFTGYVPYESLVAFYARMAVFVAPVWRESFGQVTPFAMLMGIPVVGYDVGALAEILGSRKQLAPREDSEALARIIVDLLDNPEKRLDVGRFNHERAVELFSLETMVDSYRSLYAETLGKAN